MAETVLIRVGPEDFDPGREMTRLGRLSNACGAVASFIGQVRGEEVRGEEGRGEEGRGEEGRGEEVRGDRVTAMTLEHYPGMTERQIGKIVAEAQTRWALAGVTVIHRVGRLLPGDNIVFVGAASRHREAALEACAFLIDWLKSRAPFWKLEETPDGERWVAAKAEDDRRAERWDDQTRTPFTFGQ